MKSQRKDRQHAENQRGRRSIRLQDWDYSSPAAYFVTICARDGNPIFGKIIGSEMRPSPLGEITLEYWAQIPEHTFNVSLDEMVIMPNHLHGILIFNSAPKSKGTSVRALHATPLPLTTMSSISPKARSLGSVIRSFKSAVTRWARKHGHPDFAWKRGYYDHIIRNQHDLARIRQYIRLNPLKWALDPYHPKD